MLKDVNGKTLIQRTYERTKASRVLDEVIIATDSDEIEVLAKGFGARVIRSVKEHKNGTERSAEAIQLCPDLQPDIVVTVWGDEPLYPSRAIDACVEMLQADKELQVVTAADRITNPTMISVDSVVKIVTDCKSHALYISRLPIPYSFRGEETDYYHVIGAMAMRTPFLFEYAKMEQTPLERIEGVEQLRIIENGYTLGIVKGDFENLGVNTPEEYEEVVKMFKKREQV